MSNKIFILLHLLILIKRHIRSLVLRHLRDLSIMPLLDIRIKVLILHRFRFLEIVDLLQIIIILILRHEIPALLPRIAYVKVRGLQSNGRNGLAQLHRAVGMVRVAGLLLGHVDLGVVAEGEMRALEFHRVSVPLLVRVELTLLLEVAEGRNA